MNELVVVFLGSKGDEPHGRKIAESLASFGIECRTEVASAHKATGHLLKLLGELDSSGRDVVYVAVAGRSNALGGVIDGNSANPVINCPPVSADFAGLDVLSSLRMPSGLGVATILEPQNCAVACAKIFALKNGEIRKKLEAYKKELERKASGK